MKKYRMEAPGKRRRWLPWLALILLVGLGLLHYMVPLWHQHSGMVWGDSFSYACFGRLLARGHLFLDGPVGRAFAVARDAEHTFRSPIWNTRILPGGQTIYSIAMGYPLFLALMLKLGGTWLMLHSNMILLFVLVLLLGFTVWEGLGRSRSDAFVAAMTMLLLLRLHPPTINQFTYLWREPLFYSCLLLSVFALVRFKHTANRAWLLLMALLMGYACCVKEANVVYVPWLGLLVLCSPAFYRRRDKWSTATACAMLFLIGMAPLLMQNLAATGNPMISPQMLRATDAAVTSKGMGLAAANTTTTLENYYWILSRNNWYAWPLLMLALLGAALSLRRPLGRALAGLAIIHLALYCQWGNAEMRHIFWVNIPYAFFMSYGFFMVFAGMNKVILRRHHWREGFCFAALLALAAWPAPWSISSGSESRHLRYQDAMRLTADIRQNIKPDGLVLANRVIRDILGAYSDISVIRMHGLVGLRKDGDSGAVVEKLMKEGTPVYFLDNTDKDPHHHMILDWAFTDQENLLSRFNLDLLSAFDRRQYRLSHLIDKNDLILYSVQQWQALKGNACLPVPENGAAFLFVNQREKTGALRIDVNSKPLPLPTNGWYYVPVYHFALSNEAEVTWHAADEQPVPAMKDLHFSGWSRSIVMDCGADAVPADAPYFPNGLMAQPPENVRRIGTGTVIRLPVRQQQNLFTFIGTSIKGSHGHLSITPAAARTFVIPIQKNQSAWFPFVVQTPHLPWSGVRNVHIASVEGDMMRVGRFVAYSAHRKVIHDPGPEVRGVVLEGALAYENMSAISNHWTFYVDGEEIRQGRFEENPFSRPFRHIQNRAGNTNAIVFHWDHAGLIQPRFLDIKATLSLRLNEHTRWMISNRGHGYEKDEDNRFFSWTDDKLSIAVPLSLGSEGYRLTLYAMDGHPTDSRSVRVIFGNQERIIKLNHKYSSHIVEFDAARQLKGLGEITFEINTWRPADLLDSPDKRDLGFRFYGIDWAPLETAR
jgi:hypothetical protein